MSQTIERPWTMPGYQGKLKPTVSMDISTAPQPTIDEMIGFTLELLIEEIITDENAQRLLTRYDELKQQGHYTLPK